MFEGKFESRARTSQSFRNRNHPRPRLLKFAGKRRALRDGVALRNEKDVIGLIPAGIPGKEKNTPYAKIWFWRYHYHTRCR